MYPCPRGPEAATRTIIIGPLFLILVEAKRASYRTFSSTLFNTQARAQGQGILVANCLPMSPIPKAVFKEEQCIHFCNRFVCPQKHKARSLIKPPFLKFFRQSARDIYFYASPFNTFSAAFLIRPVPLSLSLSLLSGS